MSNTQSVTTVAPSRIDYPVSESVANRLRASTQSPLQEAVRADQVEISQDALSLEAQGRDIRSSLVARIRGEIAAGTYITDDKIDQAVEGLRADIDA